MIGNWYTIKVLLVVISCEGNVAAITMHHLRYCENGKFYYVL